MKKVFVLIALTMLFIIFYSKDEDIEVLEKANVSQLKSIVYVQTTTAYSESDGKIEQQKKIYYLKPDKIRIESLDNLHEVEIINMYKYVYYNDRLDKIIIRQTIPKIEIELYDAFSLPYDSKAEFQGYETRGNVTYKIFALKSNLDDLRYTKKIWAFDYEGINLPYKIEYFINNTIVSQSKFDYISINKPIEEDMFSLNSLPQKNLTYDGSEPIYFLNIEDTLKYINFIPKDSVNHNFYLSEIKLNRIEEETILGMTFIKDNLRIYVNEKKSEKNTKGYSIKSEGDNIIINFTEDGVNVEVIGKVENYVDIMQFCSSITNKINFEAIDGEHEDE